MNSPDKTDLLSSNASAPSPGDDARRLLDEFAVGGRSEEVFYRLVKCLAPMVHSSAHRRTNDAGLAEEVAQNVFADLARKASSLRHHKALLAWIFKATRYEASKALRAARSRERKHNAAFASAETAMIMSTRDNEDSWSEAIPLLDASLDELGTKDRQFVLARFYEGKKFSEIASDNHTTEAASKMRVKRALGKLSKLLSARGVSLSITAISTGLGVELSKAAPAKVVAALASNALAVGPAATASTLASNSFQIMNTAKTVTASVVVIIALASIPLISQQSDARKMKSELAGLNERRNAVASGKYSKSATRSFVRTVHDILSKKTNDSLNVSDMISELAIAMTSEDAIGIFEIFLTVADLNQDEYQDLLAQLENYKGNGDFREMFTHMLMMFAPAESSGWSIERMLKIGAEPYKCADVLGRWANEDPSSAIAWFLEKSVAGELEGAAVRDGNEAILFSKLVGGVARKDPGEAIDLLLKFSKDSDQIFSSSYYELAEGLGAWMAGEGNGDDTELGRLLALSENQNKRAEILSSAMETAIDKNDIKGAVDLIDKHLDDGARRDSLIVDRVTDSELGIAGKIEAARRYLSGEEIADGVSSIVDAGWHEQQDEIETWTAGQQEGEVRDAAYLSISRQYAGGLGGGQFQKAHEMAGKIGDPKQRNKALQEFVGLWYRSDEAAARAALPDGIILELENAE